MSQTLTSYANKEVSLQYEGQRISFFLSQALFSSYDIDQGSRLLLKSISGSIDFSGTHRVLDIGCGVGTLGLTLKKKYPRMEMVLQDRDALAAAFSRINAEKNGISDITILGGLAFEGLDGRLFDLIVSNVPAKVGTPVLLHFYRQTLEHLATHGTAAIVVVNPIADLTLDSLLEAGADVTLREPASGHTVVHFTHGGKKAAPAGASAKVTPAAEENATGQRDGKFPHYLKPYARSRIECAAGGVEYTLDTVWGEADFDTPPYTAALVARMLKTIPPQRKITVWNPGQGHIPVTAALLMLQKGAQPLHVYCAGRDMLALQITAHNLRRNTGISDDMLEIQHAADPGFISGVQSAPELSSAGLRDLMVVECENLAGVPDPATALSAAERLLRPGGFLLLSGKSAHIHRFFSGKSSFSRHGEKKQHGYRVVALKRL